MSQSFVSERDGRILTEWFYELDADRGARAELRRCSTVLEILFCPSFADLVVRMFPGTTTGTDVRKETMQALARTALVLSSMDDVCPTVKVAQALASSADGSKAVSKLRAGTLFRVLDADEAARMLKSLRGLLQPFDPADLYNGMRRWASCRSDWAMNYNLAVAKAAKSKS
jgi:CRISPR type I-E-associated protein CasB/Cse2